MSRRSRSVASAILMLVVSLAWCASATVDGQGLQRKPFLTVFDANGTRVGHVIATPGTPQQQSFAVIAFGIDQYVFTLQVYRQRFVGNGFGGVFFELANCSGTPFLQDLDPANALLPIVAVAHLGTTLYVADAHDTAHEIIARSKLPSATDREPSGPCLIIDPVVPTVRRALVLVDLGACFSPPFSVR